MLLEPIVGLLWIVHWPGLYTYSLLFLNNFVR